MRGTLCPKFLNHPARMVRCRLRLPRPVRAVLGTIENAGGRGYVVGGAVRDILMGRQPEDWDIAATLPQQTLLKIFPSGRDYGGRYGTVRMIWPGGRCDVTPCRSEGDYRDHRHPSRVHFHGNILLDLGRRDFTVNAMAYDGVWLVDPFGGQADLRRKILRCVGRPADRFREDPLRMMRLFRFCAVLGFGAEQDALRAVLDGAGQVELVSRERVREEMAKILSSGGPQALRPLVEMGALCRYGLCHAPPLDALAKADEDPLYRWWALITLCGADTDRVGEAFGFSGRQRRLWRDFTRLYQQGPAKTRAELKLKICDIQFDYAPLTKTFAALAPGHEKETALLEWVVALGEPYRVRDLAVDGEMLRQAGFTGKDCGRMLDKLLFAVIQAPTMNTPEALLELACGGHLVP